MLVTEASRNKALKQALQLALESGEGVESLAAGIRQRLVSIGRAQSRLSTNKGREMLAELKRLHETITEQVANDDPAEALSLMWQLIELHDPLRMRTRDRAGRLPAFFIGIVPSLATLAERAGLDADQIAGDVYQRFMADGDGIYKGLVTAMAGALGADGLAALRQQFMAARDAHLKGTRRVQSAVAYDRSLSLMQAGLRAIADATGDVDGYLATFSVSDTRHPVHATDMATRLANADRGDEALAVLDHAEPDFDDTPDCHIDWSNARLLALGKLGRTDDVKALNWELFETYLSREHLRAYLKLLPDFDDMEAEEQALNWVARHSAFMPALLFLVRWPALPRAAHLVTERTREIDASHYDLLVPAAEALDGKFPLAGILIRRALIAFILKLGRRHRFKQAMQHVRELEALHAAVEDYADHEDHQAFMERLWLDHPHAAGFWSLME